MTLDINPDITEVEAAMKLLSAETKGIGRTISRYVGYAAKKWIVKRMGNFIRNRRRGGPAALTGAKGGRLKQGDTGRGLFGSIYYKARGQGGVVTTALGYYGEPLEKGWTVRPKKGFIKFRGDDGKWKTAHVFNIPARRWFSGAEVGFQESPQMTLAVEGPLAMAIKKAGLKP